MSVIFTFYPSYKNAKDLKKTIQTLSEEAG